MSDKPTWLRNPAPQSHEEMRTAWEGKLEELEDTDDQIDAILDAVHGPGVERDTIVMMISDNGYLLGEHRLFGKARPYEPSVCIPFVIHEPGITAGTPTALVSQVDLMPTTLAIAGLDPDAGRVLDGRNLLPHLQTGQWAGWRRRLMVENPHKQWALLREGDDAFVDYYSRGEQELYHLATDAHELSSEVSRPGARGPATATASTLGPPAVGEYARLLAALRASQRSCPQSPRGVSSPVGAGTWNTHGMQTLGGGHAREDDVRHRDDTGGHVPRTLGSPCGRDECRGHTDDLPWKAGDHHGHHWR
ncbi:hypothetical protein ACVW2K_002912 [Nocardioides sp. HB32]